MAAALRDMLGTLDPLLEWSFGENGFGAFNAVRF
jgi:hypothetical protein